jgi:hypothetical protein
VEKFVSVAGIRWASTTTWAFLWLGDIEKLEGLLESEQDALAVFDVEKDLKFVQLCSLLNVTIMFSILLIFQGLQETMPASTRFSAGTLPDEKNGDIWRWVIKKCNARPGEGL